MLEYECVELPRKNARRKVAARASRGNLPRMNAGSADVIIVGAGLSGLAAAAEVIAAGKRVIMAAPHLGCWELLTYWL